jgi:hypothetical protein
VVTAELKEHSHAGSGVERKWRGQKEKQQTQKRRRETKRARAVSDIGGWLGVKKWNNRSE